MSTRAEQFHSEQQREDSREHRAQAERRRKPKPRPGPGHRSHKASKATYARERQPAEGRPSRKSTRASANRSKPDAGFNRREELVKGSPESRYGKSSARGKRVRGG